MSENKDEHWFGEWVPIFNDVDINDGRKYLLNWKKYILYKLHTMNQIHADHWIERDVEPLEFCISPYKTLALKICLKGEYPELAGYLKPRELGMPYD